MKNTNILKQLIQAYDSYKVILPITITKDITRDGYNDIVIWKSPMNTINITSEEEFEREYRNQDHDNRITSNDIIYKGNDGEKIKNIVMSNKDYKRTLESILSYLNEPEMIINDDSANYLKTILDEYEQYNKTRYMNVSLLAKYENNWDFPMIVIWEDTDKSINVSSSEEYDIICRLYRIKNFKDGDYLNIKDNKGKMDVNMSLKLSDTHKLAPKKLFIVEGKNEVNDVIELLMSNKSYDEKINGLISIVAKDKKLVLK